MPTIPIEGFGKSASPEEGQAPGSADLLQEGWESAELRVAEHREDDSLPHVTRKAWLPGLRKETLIGRDKMR